MCCNPVDNGDPYEKEDEQNDPGRGEAFAQETEGKRVEICKAAAVDLRVVAVRQLAVQHAIRALRESAFVVRHPATHQVPPGVDAAEAPNNEQNRPPT